MVLVGSARIDEHGNARGGTAGDQTRREVVDQPWYKHALGWLVIRLKDSTRRPKIAVAMRAACRNELIGYDQNQRDTLYAAAKLVGFNLAKVNKACETDCSALVRTCLASVGVLVPQSPRFSTSTMVSILRATGLFEILSNPLYTDHSERLMAGDILVTKRTGHTVVVLNDGELANQPLPTMVAGVAPFDLSDVPTLQNGNKGKAVAYLQMLLVQHGATMPKSVKKTGDYGYDGEWGSETEDKFADFQRAHKDLNGRQLKVDGECGPLSWGALIGVPCKKK